MKIAVVGYKNQQVGPWDMTSVSTGLTGSEESVVYASEQLTVMGHTVTIYMNPTPQVREPPTQKSNELVCPHPRWFDVDYYTDKNNNEQYDLVLMWRRYDVETGRLRGKKVFYWPHDIPRTTKNKYQFPNFDGICILSQYHRKKFMEYFYNFDTIPHQICGNGVVIEHFDKPMSFDNPCSIGYFSNYARGLSILLSIWPEIYKEFPKCTLSICYGRQVWGCISPLELEKMISIMNSLKPMGVVEHGKVGHIKLAAIMQHTSIWAYPCNTDDETFCITAVKCQLAGMIPVTSRIGALNETIHQEAPHIELIKDQNDIRNYKNLLKSTLLRISSSKPEDLVKERQKYIQFAKKFSWQACVDKWIKLYDQVKDL